MNKLITIREVTNGWIMEVLDDSSYENNRSSTYVFNSIENLCNTLHEIYVIDEVV